MQSFPLNTTNAEVASSCAGRSQTIDQAASKLWSEYRQDPMKALAQLQKQLSESPAGHVLETTPS